MRFALFLAVLLAPFTASADCMDNARASFMTCYQECPALMSEIARENCRQACNVRYQHAKRQCQRGFIELVEELSEAQH